MNLHQDNIPKSWDGNDLFEYLKKQDEFNPPIRRLLGYDTEWAEELGMVWKGMETWEDLMFMYINKDLWGFK
tara:strand:- start:1864 stop:2079 length:216 start_codon:yes stop_codon:yes gene_type:complete